MRYFLRHLTTGRGWHPSQLGDAPKMWLNADDYHLMTDAGSGVLSNWIDRIGNVSFAASGAERPTWSATGFTGTDGVTRSGVTADGVANMMHATPIPAGRIPSGAEPGEMWVSVNYPTNDTNAIMAIGNASASTNARTVRRAGTAPNTRHGGIIEGVAATAALAAVPATTGPAVVGINCDGVSIGGRQNGRTIEAVAVTPNTTPTRARIFCGATASLFVDATARHFLWTGLLTLRDRVRLEGWLAWDAGHNGSNTLLLPADHKFFAGRP
jgi:hypothetical protein